MRLEAMRARLIERIGNAPDARTVAEVASQTWHRMVAELVPVIGARGVEVLFSRALHLTSATFPWLTTARERGDGAVPFSVLVPRLEAHDAAAATQAASLVLGTFVELLAALIGGALTERLLIPIWTPVAPARKPENEAP
jgi:hypothetical protein